MKDRVWAEIDLDALEDNARAVRGKLINTKLCAVVKADAYGHGAARCARRLEDAGGADSFAVACIEEARVLRGAGIKSPVSVMGYTNPEHAPELAELKLTQCVFDADYAAELDARAEGKIDAHIKLDTGMNRLGVRGADDIRRILALPRLDVSAVFTHLSGADAPGDAYTERQLRIFDEITEKFPEIKNFHCLNSGGVLYYNREGFAARSGILLFTGEKPVMTLKARVAQVKTVETGGRVSYGGAYSAPGKIECAVVTAGYADGYFRSLSNNAYVTINGADCPQIGRVCMDMLMADATGANAERGGEVILFGRGGMSAEETARRAGTIPYEVLCSVSKRVERIYF